MRTIEEELYNYAMGVKPNGRHYIRTNKSGRTIFKENQNVTKSQDFLDNYWKHRKNN